MDNLDQQIAATVRQNGVGICTQSTNSSRT